MAFASVDRPRSNFKQKPLRQQTELNPFGRLRENLQAAILFEASGALYDYVAPGRIFTPMSTTVQTILAGSGNTFTDGSGNVWSISPSLVALENGTSPAFSSNVVQLSLISGIIYQENTAAQWYYFNPSGPSWLAFYTDPFAGAAIPVYGNSVAGGWVNTGSFGFIVMGSATPTPGAFTVSASIYFPGALPGVTSFVTTDGAGNDHFYIQGTNGATPGALSFNGSSTQIGSWNAANYTGWHRITVTAPASTGTGSFYFDGALQGTGTIILATSTFTNLLGDTVESTNTTYLIADTIVWNRQLGASEVAYHNAEPYGSILRPRFSRLARVGSGHKAKTGLTLMGVGA